VNSQTPADNATLLRWSLALGALGALAGLLVADWLSVGAGAAIAGYGWAVYRGWVQG